MISVVMERRKKTSFPFLIKNGYNGAKEKEYVLHLYS